jgi:hypothetical protein
VVAARVVDGSPAASGLIQMELFSSGLSMLDPSSAGPQSYRAAAPPLLRFRSLASHALRTKVACHRWRCRKLGSVPIVDLEAEVDKGPDCILAFGLGPPL